MTRGLTVEGPITGSSLPYRSAHNADSSLYLDLDAFGYREDEFFLSGHLPEAGEVFTFTTRALVRQPANPADFSGVVHLEVFHMLNEDTPAWSNSYRHIVRRGDAWVGVTVNSGGLRPTDESMPGGIALLRAADPERYGRLHLPLFASGHSRAEQLGPAGFDPDEMQARMAAANALGPVIVGRLAQLLKSSEQPLLLGRSAQRVYAQGWSQTGVFWRDYLEAGRHELDRDGSGRRAIDGYLVAVATGVAQRPRDAVLVQLLSETEIIGLLRDPAMVEPDTDVPCYRGYEVPGSFHLWHVPARIATVHPDGTHNDRPWWVIVHAILAAIDDWLVGDVPLPRAPRIARDPHAPDGIARDRHGNAIGGLRTPWVDAPSFAYRPRCSCSVVVGALEPLDSPADPGDFAAAADAMVKRGLLLNDDLGAVLAQP